MLRFVQRFQPALVGTREDVHARRRRSSTPSASRSELEKALRPKVWLKSGGYIVINQTEALVAIDVNTGKYVGKSNRLEDTIVKTNIEAVKEIVRQIRLRDLGGIIVVDFIDMDERKNRQKVMQALEEAMRADRAPYKILPVQRFRPGGDHPQAGQAEPGAHALLAVPVLRRRRLRQERADGDRRDPRRRPARSRR